MNVKRPFEKKKTFLWQLKTELFSIYEVTAKASTSPFLDSEIEEWNGLDQMVKQGLAEFERLWKERAEEGRSKLNWTTADDDSKGGGADEESLSPGSVVRVALKERFKFVDAYTTINGDSSMGASPKSQLQHKLGKLLINVCLKDDGTKVKLRLKKQLITYLT